MTNITPIEMVVAIVLIVFVYKLLRYFLALHYRDSGRRSERDRQLKDDELEQLFEQSQNMEERIKLLEDILDKDLPGWRSHKT